MDIKSISPELQKSIMEVLKGNQVKIDKNKNGKIDKEDFKLLKKEETEEQVEAAVEEGWDDMLKAVKEKQKPQPNGGAGKKQGTAYGGSKQKEQKEPVKEEKLSAEEADRVAQIAKELGL